MVKSWGHPPGTSLPVTLPRFGWRHGKLVNALFLARQGSLRIVIAIPIPHVSLQIPCCVANLRFLLFVIFLLCFLHFTS